MEKIKENTTYKEGDVVVYGSQGICRITGTEKMRVGGKSTVYFILNPKPSTPSTGKFKYL